MSAPTINPPRKSEIHFDNWTNVHPTNTTKYYYGGNTWSSTEALLNVPRPFRCLLRNLRVKTHNAPGAGETYIFMIRRDPAPGGAPQNTTITCTIAGGVDQRAEDLVNIVEFAAGDLMCLRMISSVGAAQPYMQGSIEVIAL